MTLFEWLKENSSNIKTVGTIFIAGYFLNVNLVSSMKDTMTEINKPLVDKVASIEKRQEEFEEKQNAFDITQQIILSERNDDNYKIKINTMCLDNVIVYINKTFSKEFVKPDELYETKEK